MSLENSGKSRRLMHTRSIECEGFLRDDGLWEVEAWLRDTKPFVQRADRFRGELKPGDPVHDIGLRLAIDEDMTIREAETMMRATPYPSCVAVEPCMYSRKPSAIRFTSTKNGTRNALSVCAITLPAPPQVSA